MFPVIEMGTKLSSLSVDYFDLQYYYGQKYGKMGFNDLFKIRLSKV